MLTLFRANLQLKGKTDLQKHTHHHLLSVTKLCKHRYLKAHNLRGYHLASQTNEMKIYGWNMWGS